MVVFMVGGFEDLVDVLERVDGSLICCDAVETSVFQKRWPLGLAHWEELVFSMGDEVRSRVCLSWGLF